MSLKGHELSQVLAILDKIDRGSRPPQLPGRIGRYLRQYGRSAAELKRELTSLGIEKRADGAVSGCEVGNIIFHALRAPTIQVRSFPLEEVAGTIGVSDELGCASHLALWLKGRAATSALNLLNAGSLSLRFTGDYRWKPPDRLTAGMSRVAEAERALAWREVRCLKAVADDLARPPHALEYVLDYTFGGPGLKCFRCVVAKQIEGAWEVLPALVKDTMALGLGSTQESDWEVGALASLLIYREPWSNSWSIADTYGIAPEAAIGHCITWVDLQRELAGMPLDPELASGVKARLSALGVSGQSIGSPNLERALLPAPRAIQRWMRGTA